ncbi:MAG TPA: flagellar basal body rod protein FlgB [bacterium]|nr:flagellar basal body rod protein FlgB [bacterium]HPN43163.1 flagellar basal body rod protein FlgB [bacterium]
MFKAVFEKMNIPIFARLLDGSSARQRAIADNIANVNTPGYKTKDVNFAELLNSTGSGNSVSVLRSDSRHIALTDNGNEQLIEEDKDSLSEPLSGINNVDIDKEMVKAAENQLYYSAASKITAAKFKSLHTSITSQ